MLGVRWIQAESSQRSKRMSLSLNLWVLKAASRERLPKIKPNWEKAEPKDLAKSGCVHLNLWVQPCLNQVRTRVRQVRHSLWSESWRGCEQNSVIKKPEFYANQNYNKVSSHTGQNGHHQKNLQTINAGEGVEKREPSCILGGKVNCYSHYGGQYGESLKC